MFAWTPECIERLTDLYLKRVPASAIAREIGAPSRNAVIGKIFRLNLRELAKAPKPKRPLKEPKPRRIAKTIPIPVAPPEPVPAAGISWDDLRADTCRFAKWGHYERPELAEMRFCGKPVLPDRSWCEKCARKVFQAHEVVMANRRRIFEAA